MTTITNMVLTTLMMPNVNDTSYDKYKYGSDDDDDNNKIWF